MTTKQIPLRLSETKMNELKSEAKALDISFNALIKIKLARVESIRQDTTLPLPIQNAKV